MSFFSKVTASSLAAIRALAASRASASPAPALAAPPPAPVADALAPFQGESSFEEVPLPFVEEAQVPPQLEAPDTEEAFEAPPSFDFVAPLVGEGVGDAFVDSEDLAAQRESLVAAAYQAVLGRAPDAGGFGSWLERAMALQVAGATPEQIALDLEAGLRNSEEAHARQAAAPQPAPFVDSPAKQAERERLVLGAYRELLGRAPDEGGFRAWVDQVKSLQAQGLGADAIAATVAEGFKASPEYAERQRALSLEPAAVAHQPLDAARELKARRIIRI